ncbi:amino acid/polyamine transporter, partial [Thalassiosira pseudonana CCMP1335]
SSMSNEMFNLVKNLVGAGAFAIPSGFASLAGGSMSKSVMIPAAAIILIMATIFVYYFILVGRLCRMTRAASYKEAFDTSAGRASAVWRRLTFLVPLSVILMAGLGNLAYSMILADTTRSLLARVGYEVSRTSSLMYITIFVLLPLCLVKKLSVLAPFSALGTGGIVFTLAVMALRCFDGTYDSQRDGRFLDVSVIVFATAVPFTFFCHYNAPRYYIELRQNTIPRFSHVANVSFGISALVYFAIGAFGYYTFGDNTNGFILNNYSTKDELATLCRFAIAIALIFTYPLPFIGTRDA